MKRLNKETKKPFKCGDVREDGFLFDAYVTSVKRGTGYFKEIWRSPEKWEKEKRRKSANKARKVQEVTRTIDKIKIGDKSWLHDIPDDILAEVEKIGILEYNGCAVCEHKNPKHLDFHHRVKSLKDKSIGSYFKTSFRQFLKAYKEMTKCDVYCSHHHRDVERTMDNRSAIRRMHNA